MSDREFMQRAFDLALKGLGHVSPNPVVGCVIVHEGRIIGEGWHQKYGKAHAEVNAIKSVEDQSLLPKSTVYVTLEPCAHHGKTPPCVDLLVKHKVKKVIIANEDPFPLVNGGGIARLKQAGIEVEVGLLADVGLELNRRFFKAITTNLPYVILKWAQTANGFVARENFDSKWISNDSSRKLVHKWRAEEDAILVGKNTVKFDNPTLNVRDWEGTDPLRVYIDRNLELVDEYNIKDGSIPTICYNTIRSSHDGHLEFVKIEEDSFVLGILMDLYQHNIQSVIIEGGSTVLREFIQAKLWDEARVFVSQKTFESGISAPRLIGNQIDSQELEGDELTIFRPY
ncbi:bifunctional diaminohydroxyphosphoribosylaminopyrimidine deaminase/5-amino-6-(5-phosphoribosylamino)uracil reductase RibD [Reichenbachiella agarivorans]|uniref:Riboflavin biosynthesis protein RibD n=1 Tax=Reichenbachiella agarivorans TaxID=2979464 RepID=A0ABY6CUC8_9BACT|nr:bifunctional diaminohydroxyphosphoribosylaminopyrimidine deaminase/5-amino-6-(5-phosphoribosylamino)uracil reductase RibD [Reichenbachiella agarivorans]UXP34121.1 bifunctional diaminohydroxyphosphoribosylaminopyrimidine deaminase/5-amino-6-(5-phosphoribosylamino)uracil reductase RibD [Reichenbachiella agarivorans]